MTFEQALRIYKLMTQLEAAGVRIRADAKTRAGLDSKQAVIDAVLEEVSRAPLP